jgi:Ala-tRNA(Pro) deacylase
MAIARAVQEFLESHDVDYEVVGHPRTVSSMRTAQAAHIPGERLAKSVLLEDDKGYLMAVIPSTCHVDLAKLHQQLHRRVGLAIEQEVAELFGDCDRGAIPPIGAAYRIDAVVDDALLRQPDVYFEAGDHEALVHMSGREFALLMAGLPHGGFTRHA